MMVLFDRLENCELPYNAFSFGEDMMRGEGLQSNCTLYRAQARLIDLKSKNLLSGNEVYGEDVRASSSPAICIELVGSRFLRRMVRILLVSADKN